MRPGPETPHWPAAFVPLLTSPPPPGASISTSSRWSVTMLQWNHLLLDSWSSTLAPRWLMPRCQCHHHHHPSLAAQEAKTRAGSWCANCCPAPHISIDKCRHRAKPRTIQTCKQCLTMLYNIWRRHLQAKAHPKLWNLRWVLIRNFIHCIS